MEYEKITISERNPDSIKDDYNLVLMHLKAAYALLCDKPLNNINPNFGETLNNFICSFTKDYKNFLNDKKYEFYYTDSNSNFDIICSNYEGLEDTFKRCYEMYCDSSKDYIVKAKISFVQRSITKSGDWIEPVAIMENGVIKEIIPKLFFMNFINGNEI